MLDINLTELLDYFLKLVEAGAYAVLVVAGLWFKSKTGVDLDVSKEGKVHRTLQQGLQYARNLATGADGELNIRAPNIMVKWAVDYVKESIPETLEHFGIDEERLAEMIIARLSPEEAKVVLQDRPDTIVEPVEESQLDMTFPMAD
jgi:hypothetical protein